MYPELFMGIVALGGTGFLVYVLVASIKDLIKSKGKKVKK